MKTWLIVDAQGAPVMWVDALTEKTARHQAYRETGVLYPMAIEDENGPPEMVWPAPKESKPYKPKE